MALHTAARRYCLERYAFWSQHYAELVRQGGDRKPDGYHYAPEALATFPRYNVLNAIRVELERILPGELIDLEEAKALLLLAGQIGEDDFTRKPIGQIDARAMAEEREAFCRYIGKLSLSELHLIEPLPYRRVLTELECKALWSRFRERWQITEHYWYPLAECPLVDVLAFNADAFKETISSDRMQSILARRGIERVYELREYGPEYEQDLSLFDPDYNGAEGYWSSEQLDWIVYASHECSVTVGGWFLKDLQEVWPSWADQVWVAPF